MNQDGDGGEVLGCGCIRMIVGLKLLEKETHLKRLILRVVKSAESRGERMPVFDRCARGGQRGGFPVAFYTHDIVFVFQSRSLLFNDFCTISP